MRRLIIVGLAIAASLGGPSLASAQHCPGTVALEYGDTASRITAQGVGCNRAKRVIRAPAVKLGYRCTNPFDRPSGSGGFVRCRKGPTRIAFLYSQA
jgi:hypothetical protein